MYRRQLGFKYSLRLRTGMKWSNEDPPAKMLLYWSTISSLQYEGTMQLYSICGERSVWSKVSIYTSIYIYMARMLFTGLCQSFLLLPHLLAV